MEYIKQFENDHICVSYVKIMPKEEIGLHYDMYPHKVKSLNGGSITRLEADGTINKVEFPKGQWVFRPAESSNKIHRSINELSTPIEMIIIQLK